MLLSTFSAQAGFSGESAVSVTVGLIVALVIVVGSAAFVLRATQALRWVFADHPMRRVLPAATLVMIGASWLLLRIPTLF